MWCGAGNGESEPGRRTMDFADATRGAMDSGMAERPFSAPEYEDRQETGPHLSAGGRDAVVGPGARSGQADRRTRRNVT